MKSGNHSLLWLRLGALAVSGAGVYVVFRQVKLSALVEAFRTIRPGWYVGAVTVYGLFFIPACARWHIILRLTRTAVHAGATVRAYLIGHFFYMLLFGAVGGDAARSALYARWHRIPLPQILATSPLDRFLGALGLALFAVLAFSLAAAAGGLHQLSRISWKWSSVWWGLLVIALVGAGWWLVRRSGPDSFGHKFLRALTTGGKLLWASPRAGLAGAACGLGMQLALSSVLALNLQAVTHTEIPWFRLVWTFPVVSLTGALPITVAGLGAREGVALMLLGIYGISSATAVAASLLTLTASFFWALVGGLLWWWESKKRRRSSPGSMHEQPLF